jgi:hypothetical protein
MYSAVKSSNFDKSICQYRPENWCGSVEGESLDKLVAPLAWAQQLKRVFNIDLTLCPYMRDPVPVITDINHRITQPVTQYVTSK